MSKATLVAGFSGAGAAIALLLVVGGKFSPSETPLQNSGPLMPIGVMQTLSTASAEEVLADSSGGSTPACFGDGSVVVLQSATDAVVNCVIHQTAYTSSITIGAAGSDDECKIADGLTGYPDGDSACVFVVGKGGRADLTLKNEELLGRPGTRNRGICPVSVPVFGERPGGRRAYPLCASDSDCVAAGSSTTTAAGGCDTTLSATDLERMRAESCAVFQCQSDTDSTSLFYRVDR